ncbi:MAG TPA: hypothetical protein ENJ95_21815 [Bacteroidetes bacterium]|nr:hypothetical protein [Bacteroidota bacterium]
MASRKKNIGNYFAFGDMSALLVLKNLPFVLFLGFLTVIYIANAHLAEKQIREIQTLRKDVKELKREYNSLKSEIMFKSRLAEIEEQVKGIGLIKKAGRVKRIKVDN